MVVNCLMSDSISAVIVQGDDSSPLEERLQGAKTFSVPMLEWIHERNSVIIIVHDNPDPDCLASALALNHLIREVTTKESTIAFSGMIGRSENLIMASLIDIPLVPLEIVDISKYDVICMLDTQPATGNNSLPSDVPVDVVIDHHPARDKSKECRWVDIREDYGVTATILYEYLIANDVAIDPVLATALFYAIKSDTQDLGREANRPDREAYLQLFPLVDKKLLYRITNPRQPIEYFRTIQRTIGNALIYSGVVVVDMEQVAFPELVAEMADFLLKLEGINAVLSYGEYAAETIISLRTSSTCAHAGELVKRLMNGIGVGGGHLLTAGGKIKKNADDNLAHTSAVSVMVDRFLAEMSVAEVVPISIKP